MKTCCRKDDLDKGGEEERALLHQAVQLQADGLRLAQHADGLRRFRHAFGERQKVDGHLLGKALAPMKACVSVQMARSK